MKSLEQLYLKPITRIINPAVVVDERDAAVIQQEIEEYVFTKGILNGIHTFVKAVTTQKQGKTGIWVNGYYGSGKSHFIKYLSYCLDNEYREKALDRYVLQAREQKDPLAEITFAVASEDQRSISKFAFDKIIFNIDHFSGDKTRNSVLVKVIFNQFNKFRGYNDSNIALALYLEKELQKIGAFEAFKQEIMTQLRGEWALNYNRFATRYLNRVLDIALQFDLNLDKVALSQAISNQNQEYRIEDLIKEFVAFLKEKPNNYRLIFLIDEVSQYIGSNTSLLLNLQTIIEGIGTSCQGKIWIACTAQQDLGNVVERTDDKKEDFGKIANSNLSGLKKIMNLDFDTNLFSDLLVKMDIATMANSLEGRSAFLSKELLEYIPSLNDAYKIKGKTAWWLIFIKKMVVLMLQDTFNTKTMLKMLLKKCIKLYISINRLNKSVKTYPLVFHNFTISDIPIIRKMVFSPFFPILFYVIST